MKRIAIIFVAVCVAISLVACGRNNSNTQNSTTAPSTDMNILPDMDPTLNTNVPDPSVDTSMPMYTDGTENTNTTNSTSSTDDSTGSGRGMG